MTDRCEMIECCYNVHIIQVKFCEAIKCSNSQFVLRKNIAWLESDYTYAQLSVLGLDFFNKSCTYLNVIFSRQGLGFLLSLKFSFSEKATKICANFLMVLMLTTECPTDVLTTSD